MKLKLFNLEGKNAFISGATGYLGRQMAFALAEAGAHVLINSRSKDKCQELVKELNELGYSAETAPFNVVDESDVNQFIDTFDKNKIDIVVSNSYAGGSGSLELSKNANFIESYESSVMGANNLLRAFLPYMRNAVKENGYASFITIGSMYGVVIPDQRVYESKKVVNPPFYGASKAALIHWTKYAACEFSNENIRFNSISPGPFPNKETQNSNPEFVKKLINKVPMGRIGCAEELKGPIVFLASNASSYVNGTNMMVDGGWTAW